MIRSILRVLVALAGEGLCERVRPTKRYTLGAYMRIDDGPWHYRKSGTTLRRPWQKYPNPPANPVSMIPMGLGSVVSMQGPALHPEDGCP